MSLIDNYFYDKDFPLIEDKHHKCRLYKSTKSEYNYKKVKAKRNQSKKSQLINRKRKVK